MRGGDTLHTALSAMSIDDGRGGSSTDHHSGHRHEATNSGLTAPGTPQGNKRMRDKYGPADDGHDAGHRSPQHHRGSEAQAAQAAAPPPPIDPATLPPELREAFYQLDPAQQRQALEMLAEQAAERERDRGRPAEHFITIALNGTILGATEMVTGFAPNNLLMTSAYDSVHDEDLLGLHAVKTHFWERDQPDVVVYLRRRNLEGEYLWLRARVVSYIDSPVPGIIIHETLAGDEGVAATIARITRIASIVLQSVEGCLYGTGGGSLAGLDIAGGNPCNGGPRGKSGEVAEGGSVDDEAAGAAEVSAMLSHAAQEMGIDVSRSDNPLRELMEAAERGGGGASPSVGGSRGDGPGGDASVKNRKSAAKPLDHLKEGSALDLSKIILCEGEVRLIALVLTGRLQIEDLGPLLYLTLNTPEMDLLSACEEFRQLSEAQMAEQQRNGVSASTPAQPITFSPPPLAVLNLSYTDIGDVGCCVLSEYLHSDNPALKTIDLSFCGITPLGFGALSDGLATRNGKGLPSVQAFSFTGNIIAHEVSGRLGRALGGCASLDDPSAANGEPQSLPPPSSLKRPRSGSTSSYSRGLQLLHLGSTSITPRALTDLLRGLGPTCPLQELKLHSNRIGADGVEDLVKFLDAKVENPNTRRKDPILPKLNRLDMSYNELGDEGITRLTRAISKRTKMSMNEVSLSGNDMGSKGIESIMNKLLQHRLLTLNLDNNSIGDLGCQLVAASLPSIPSLSRLNLAFNEIGCRGMATLMRSLVGCESITSLGLSGNVVKISGAIAMGFTLAQHPRLSVLELDNCCLSQVAQCHIVAGIISNRWVPMKVMHGFRAGPPMVAIGALEIMAQHLSNEECFRLRRDIQMKTLLQWMEANKKGTAGGNTWLTSDVLSGAQNASDAPSQSAYLRMLDWLGRIPFDESELMDLRRYFYDVGGGEEAKSTNNLKHRGDILAALASEVVEEILESEPLVYFHGDESVGLDLDKVAGVVPEDAGRVDALPDDVMPSKPEEIGELSGARIEFQGKSQVDLANGGPFSRADKSRSSMSTISASMGDGLMSRGSKGSKSTGSTNTMGESVMHRARITMFPQFETKLDNLKAVAQDMMDSEEDPNQQDVIAQQFAEASLTILRQLRYHCMESGLDGWRQGRLRRKVLIVDDSVVTRKMVARAFEKANFIVDTAEDGVKGVVKMKESIYDIAFMDIDMPVMNGFDATKALRMWEDSVRPGARQPICALTAAHIDDFDRSELMKFKDAGLDVMESKPCNIPRLFKVVDDVSPMFSDLSIQNASHGSSLASDDMA
mmetsp:Transcript_20893/g.48055  ORF Transcript_20893/g.48055 Transcript_20893/m.48055 type:complete len:1295 (-) Transcript_20893:84-3968(-)